MIHDSVGWSKNRIACCPVANFGMDQFSWLVGLLYSLRLNGDLIGFNGNIVGIFHDTHTCQSSTFQSNTVG